jgi:hypothetical protein
MSNTVEFDLARLTAQSSGPNPKEPGGGLPMYTRQEILACLAEVPHTAFHCLMAKYCGDDLSAHEVLRRARMMSLQEWFTNAEHTTKKIEAGQLNKVAELAVLAWLNPHGPHSESNQTRSTYTGIPFGTWRANFQSHYGWIVGELEYFERLGDSTYRNRKYGHKDGIIHVTECRTCGGRINA